MATIQAVVFDIGNVLLEWHPERYYDRLIGQDRRRTMFAEVDLHSINERVDLGDDIRTLIYAAADDNPKWSVEIRHWYDNWIDMAAPYIPHSGKLLRALKAANVPVFALSNFGIETYALAQKTYPVLNEFDQQFISGHLKCIKPDPAIYAHLENDTGVDPTTLLFADDKQENLDAAAARGWQTHLFTSPAGFEKRLIHEGLLEKGALK